MSEKTLPFRDQRLDGVALTKALGFKSTWVVPAVKKANAHLAAQGKEALIFTGRYSTPAKITQWLDEHPDFVANHVLVTPERRQAYQERKSARRRAERAAKAAAAPAKETRRPRRPLAA
jgi:GAF domain-containing protein